MNFCANNTLVEIVRDGGVFRGTYFIVQIIMMSLSINMASNTKHC